MRYLLLAVLLVALAGSAVSADVTVATDPVAIQAAIDAAAPGENIYISAGSCTVSGTININKGVNLIGAGPTATFINVDGVNHSFVITGNGASIQNLCIQKTNKTTQAGIIWIFANNVTIKDNVIFGQYVLGDPEVSRAMVISGGLSGLLIKGNTIHSLRQPAYVSGVTTGSVENNYVAGTRGWVIEGGNLTFTGNTWGTLAQSNFLDIAILATVGTSYYRDVQAMSVANNFARINDQRPTSIFRAVTPGMLSPTKADFALGVNPFGFDWDSAAPAVLIGAPAGYGTSSFYASVNQSGATPADRYRTLRTNLAALFGQSVTVGSIANFSYMTKKTAATDWRVCMYTAPQGTGDASSWYRNRIESRSSCNGPITGDWARWATEDNSMLFGANRAGYYNQDIEWSDLIAGPVGAGWDFSGESVMFIDLILGANSGGGTGASQLDAVRFDLADGKQAVVDLSGNQLLLEVPAPSAYIKRGESAVIQMKVAQLTQSVNACQAMLGYSSSVFGDPTDQGEPNHYFAVQPGGGVWDEVIWDSWAVGSGVPGQIDTAIGIKVAGVSTTADGTVALITLTAKSGAPEGPTQVVFRADDPVVDTKQTFLSTPGVPSVAVWPVKYNSTDIIIDGTPPSITCPADVEVGTDAGQCFATGVDLGTPTVTDTYGVASVTNDAPTTFPKGETIVTWTATDNAGNSATCTQKVKVNDTELPVITCPAGVTAGYGDPTDPPATGVATATDNCTPAPVISYNDDRSGLTNCNATGVIVRTWKATDSSGNFATCTQTITVVDGTDPIISGCPGNIEQNNDAGQCGAVVTWTAPTAIDQVYAEGFENTQFAAGPWQTMPSVGWNEYNSMLTRATSGTDGVTSKSGAAHGVIDSTALPLSPNDWTGAFCRLRGYSSVFGTGFKSSVDVYMDLSDPAVTANTYGWDCSTAACNQSGGHLRDFIFHTASNASGQILVAGSNNSNFTRRNDLASINHYTITASGWYTFEWDFRDNGGVLAVDLNLRDAAGNLLWTETRNSTDSIASVVGGNRYMWFTFVAANKLAIDNTTLVRKVPVICTPASGSTFPVGTTAVACTATDACGNDATCGFSVTVTDAEKPVVATATAAPALVKDQDVTITAAGTDNCTAPGYLAWEHKVGAGAWKAGLVVANADLAEKMNTLSVRAKDAAGNYSDAFTATPDVRKDTTAPTISVDAAVEATVNVLDGASNTLQGTVTITVLAADTDGSGISGAPAVTLTNGSVVTLTTTDTASPFHYTWTVDSATANGTWNISASISDQAGNSASDTNNYLVVNKNQITGQIELEGFVGTARTVAFYINGSVAGTLAAPLAFSGGTATYILVNVPDGASTLSAKTAWSLREKIALVGGTGNQWTANFTSDGVEGWSDASDHYLRGGDLNNTNSINVLDYSLMKTSWGGGTVGDIDGDGSTGSLDYGIMKINWFKTGDLQ